MLMGSSSMNSSEGKLLGDDRFLRRVAHLYYDDGQRQEAIAEMENCSRQTVGKALQRARERGIVRIIIIPEQRTAYLRNLSRELRVRLDLEDLVIVPGRSYNGQSSSDGTDDVLIEIATHAADYLDQMLTNKDILAVSGGTDIMRNVVRCLKPTKYLPELEVVPTIGFSRTQTSLGDANLIAYDIAVAYGARHDWFAAPAIVKTQEQCNQVRTLPLVGDVLKKVEQATIVMTGLWTPRINGEVIAKGILSKEQLDALEPYHPVANINHWAFDEAGRCINYLLPSPSYYLTGLEIPKLREKVMEGRVKVILVAGADPAYAIAIRAALRAGLANILVTDHVTAHLLMQSEQPIDTHA